MTTENTLTRPDTRPDLDDLIGTHPHGELAETAWQKLQEIAAKDPAYVAYFATGSVDQNYQAAWATLALLDTPEGIEALKSALQDQLPAPEDDMPIKDPAAGERYIRFAICDDHDGGARVEICFCGERDPNRISINSDVVRCDNCGSTRTGTEATDRT